MYLPALIQFLVLTLTLSVDSNVLPSTWSLQSRGYTKSKFAPSHLQKRADGKKLYDAVQEKYNLKNPCDVKKEDIYARSYKPFETLPDQRAPFDITEVLNALPGVNTPAIFARRSNTCSSLGFPDIQRGECFDNFYSISSGIIIGENNDRRKDLVSPKSEQLHWSDIAFYTYKALIEEDQKKQTLTSSAHSVKDIKYIFRHSITNDETKKLISKQYKNLDLDRITMQTWTYGDTAKRAGFLAILGTANGQGAAYMLVSHGAEMVFKNIDSIVTFPNPEGKNRDAFYVALGPSRDP